MKRLLALLALASAGQMAQAVTATALPLAEQARKAQVIVRAKLEQPTDLKEGDVTYLAYPLTISETVYGNTAALPQVGGKPALVFLSGAQDIPKLSAGQEALLLLYTGKMDSPVVGYNQGAYLITAGKVSAGDPKDPVTDPDKLRDAIRAAREGK